MGHHEALVKRLASAAARGMARAGVLRALERLDGRRQGRLRVLTYHRVNEPGAAPHLYPGLLSATPQAFERQAAYLAARCSVVSLGEVMAAQAGHSDLPPRAVLLTFDDAYRDFADVAWPILQRYRLPVTLFVPTAFPGRADGFWWDRVHRALERAAGRGALATPLGRLSVATAADRHHACVRLNGHVKALPHREAMQFVDGLAGRRGGDGEGQDVLDWGELKRLSAEGVTLGAHTRTHPLMNRVPLTEALDEAAGSLDDLLGRVDTAAPALAYPGGGVNGDLAAGLRDRGFRLAFTTAHGHNELSAADPLMLSRINVGRRTTLDVLRLRLAA